MVGFAHVADVTKDDVLGFDILRQCPEDAIQGPAGALHPSLLITRRIFVSRRYN